MTGVAGSSDWQKSGQQRSGWSGAELTKAGVSLEFDAAQLAALDELMAAVSARGLAMEQITLADFSHPALDGLLAEVLRRIKRGPGLVVLGRFPVERYSLDDIEKMYWGIGTHFGRACSQSASGDLMGHVTNRGNSRGYNSARQLPMHVDSAETVGLLCIRKARQGGENALASALRMYEILERDYPQYLPVLERGFRYHRRGEEAVGEEPISPYNVPVFSREQGVLSCRYSRERIDLAARDLGQPLSAFEVEALDFFEALAFRDDVRFDLQLEPGEVLFTSNFEMLHSRTGFVDWEEPDRRRLVLRLWLEGEPPRPLKREVFTYQNRSGRQGIDRQEDRRIGDDAYQPVTAKAAGGARLVDG